MGTKLTTTTVMLFLAIWLSLILCSPANAAISGGKFGNALEFDGVDDFVQVPDSSSLKSFSTEITIEAWVYFEPGSTGTQLLIRKWLDVDGGWASYVLGKQDDGRIYGSVMNKALDQDPTWYTNKTVSVLGIEGTWAYVAFTWKKDALTSVDGKFFINGLGVATTFEPRGYSQAFTIGYGDYPLYFARKADSLAFTSNYFKGGLDEIRISNIARTSFSLTAPPSVDANTVALWHFDESAGLTASDASPNGNHGTISGATIIIPEFPTPVAITILLVVLSAVLLFFRKRSMQPLKLRTLP